MQNIGALELQIANLNGMQLFFMLLITPVLFLHMSRWLVVVYHPVATHV